MKPNANLEKAMRLREYLQTKAGRIIGVLAVQHFKKSFRDEGFTDDVLVKWTPSRRKAKGRGAYASRPTLTQSGALADSIDYRTDLNKVYVGTSKPYARVHNEGLRITGLQIVRAHSRRMGRKTVSVRAHKRNVNFKMPKRQFMGRSKVLTQKIVKKLDEDIRNIL